MIVGFLSAATGFGAVATVPVGLRVSATRCRKLRASPKLQALSRMGEGLRDPQALRAALHESVRGCRQLVAWSESYGGAVPCRRQTWPCLVCLARAAAVEAAGLSSLGRPCWVCRWESSAGAKVKTSRKESAPQTVKLENDVACTTVYGSGRKLPHYVG